MDFKKLHNLIEEMKFPKFREKQIRQAYFVNLASDWQEITVLPKEIREKFAGQLPWSLVTPTEILKDKRGETLKAVFKLEDENLIESVLIKHKDGRRTVCVSSQVGCPMACSFCATGKGGFKRDLTREEIVDQVLYFARELKIRGEKVSNVVFMGMGEPLLNYDNVIKAINMLNDKEGFNLGARHISISTCGIVPGIKKLAGEKLQVNLALSLHAPSNKLRLNLMPVNKAYNLEKVMEAIDFYIKKTNRRVMIEYLLIEGVNDGEREAQELSEILKDRLLCYVNLIPYNETGVFKASSKDKIQKFTSVLDKNKTKYTIRHQFGEIIGAACGQLAGKRK